jgi:hypothetical protein
MIIRIKKRDFLIASLALFLIIFIPIIYAQTQTPKRAGFGVWLIIGNQNPNVTISNVSGFTVDPISGSNAVILISFNVSDPDGAGQVNGSYGGKAVVNLTLGSPSVAQFRTQTSCTNSTLSSTRVTFNCTINLRYYDNNSAAWVINITVIDSNSGIGRNDSKIFTYNSLAAFSLTAGGVSEGANINFTSLNLGDLNRVAKAPLLLNNTGNSDFDQINITAALLYGVTTASETIDPSSFAVNITNNTAGNGLALSTTPVVVRGVDDNANATLFHGPGISGDSVPYIGTGDFTTKGNLSLLFFVDVPSSGLSAQTYNTTWNMTVVDLS